MWRSRAHFSTRLPFWKSHTDETMPSFILSFICYLFVSYGELLECNPWKKSWSIVRDNIYSSRQNKYDIAGLTASLTWYASYIMIPICPYNKTRISRTDLLVLQKQVPREDWIFPAVSYYSHILFWRFHSIVEDFFTLWIWFSKCCPSFLSFIRTNKMSTCLNTPV